MKKSLSFLMIAFPILSWGQFAEMTPTRIFARKKILNEFFVNDSTVFFWNTNKGSLRAGLAKTDNYAPYSEAFREVNIGNYSLAYGTNNIASGTNSFAGGSRNISSGINSVALGNLSEASIGNSFALGYNAKASANGAVAFSNGQAKADFSLAFSGGSTESVGSLAFHNGKTTNLGSFAIGESAVATERYSAAIGRNITSNSKYCLVVGQFNDPTINTAGQDDANSPRFVVGTGYSGVNNINGFVVYQSGNATHKGRISVNTASLPRASLDVVGTDAIIIPVGTSAQRPSTPIVGMIRYNSEIDKYEGYVQDAGSGAPGWKGLH
ncbi:hypothetical protein [Runella salmonicolor]|uniref:Trimeric autotransporter adhesin YadA-like head domain-containing protein n=1 Tax=Runella salmonicolor TaxID=2950278 RepID=A0ABT1FTA1_9BACT|nr:hypothetical protein [Runella salmonicolor]MCP1384725.1 hypothetical protein [Runella salmonicolor]